MRSGSENGIHSVQAIAPDAKLIDLKRLAQKPSGQHLLTMLQAPIEKMLALDRINQLYQQFYSSVADCKEPKAVYQACLDLLDVTYSVSQADLEKIPSRGALVVVANHPFGGIEGIVLGRLLLEARSDVRILANYLLKYIGGIRDIIIPVNPFNTPNAPVSNLRGIKEAIDWLNGGGAMATFPAGEVASFQFRKGGVVDPQWAANLGSLVRRTQASVLPVYFPGKNSMLFQILGLINPKLRTLMLPRELVSKVGRKTEINLFVGKSIPWRKLKRLESDEAIVQYLRLNTFFLKNRSSQKKLSLPALPLPKPMPAGPQPVIPPVDSRLLKNDIQALPDVQHLVRNGDLSVYVANAGQIPNLINEIGRLREITFREVDEGTGNAIDLDRFDAYYLHLFLWNHKEDELVGAYRLGCSDVILDRFGPKGLYTNELFRYKPAFIQRLSNAIETGRSFVRSEYQKKFNSLMLLWRGIGEFIARNPRYRILYGPVSISKDYNAVSKTLMIRFLKQNNFDSSLSRFVSPRKPYRVRRMRGINKRVLRFSFHDIDDISVLISEIEKDGKGVPILLRHYLKLNGNLISFNVDKAFSSVVDGLLLVDLNQTDPKLLKRFMGENGYENFKRDPQLIPHAEHLPAYLRANPSNR